MTDDEAATLGADHQAALAYYEIWSANHGGVPTARRETIPSAFPRGLDRVLLDISTVGRGGEPAKIRVTTSRVFISTTGGVSVWKAFLGAATLGLSTAVTGINAGIGGDLDIPIGVVTGAVITKTGLAYSTVKLVIGGDAIEVGLAAISCGAVVGAINAAVSGADRAAVAAEAWEIHRQGGAKQWPREGHLQRQLKRGQITQARFEHDLGVSRALQSLSTV